MKNTRHLTRASSPKRFEAQTNEDERDPFR